MHKSQSETNKLPRAIWVIVSICTVISVLTGGLYVYQFGFGLWTDSSKWGQLGDYIGGILNPIVSLSALGVLVYTVRLQIKELSDTKDALKNQLVAMDESRASDVFFKLFQIHSDIINEVHYIFYFERHDEVSHGVESRETRGKKAFIKHLADFTNKHLFRVRRGDYAEDKETIEPYRTVFGMFYNDSKAFGLDRYFDSVAILLNFLEMVKSNNIRTDFYYKVLLSSFNEAEAALIFYYFTLFERSNLYIDALRENDLYDLVHRELIDEITSKATPAM